MDVYDPYHVCSESSQAGADWIQRLSDDAV